MPRPTKYPYTMSLRLAANMQDELDNMAYEFRISRAQFIRRALHRAIADAYQHELPITTFQAQGGGR